MLKSTIRALACATVLATSLSVPSTVASAAGPNAGVADLPAGTQRPTTDVLLSVGEGQSISLPSAVSDVWISNPATADVYVRSSRQLYLFGKDGGEATMFATNASGQTVYAANIRVSQNISSIDRMLKLAMPEAAVRVTTAGQLAVLTGTVASPDDSTQAEQLVRAHLNPGVDTNAPGAVLKIGVVNRLKTATPLQVNLHVKIAEVSRTLTKNFNTNLQTFDSTGGFQFGIGRGRNAKLYTPGGGLFTGADESTAGTTSLPTAPQSTTLGLAGRLLGLDILSALDLAENEGLVTTLANPNLTALSGETASFLAGGEFPIPVSQGLGSVSIEYKQYGVSLAFTPTVLADGRISMRVRPEVSELTSEGSVVINNFTVPGLTTRRTETTVELGSGQSFMIGGLLRNVHNSSIDRTPGLGKVPVLGALFRSTAFRKQQTELVIIVTPYLVKPVSANEIALPTDGYRSANDLQRFLLGQNASPSAGAGRPVPTTAPPRRVPPSAAPAPGGAGAAVPAAPGFSF